MLEIMHVLRDSSQLTVTVSQATMYVGFVDPSKEVNITWKLTGYPKEFQWAANQVVQFTSGLTHFKLFPDAEYFAGSFEVVEGLPLVSLIFKQHPLNSTEFRIRLRKDEISKLYKIIDDYWTC